MRKLFIVAIAIAAASCGGNQNNLSKDEAEAVGSALSDALSATSVGSQDAASTASARNLLTLSTGIDVTRQCAGGGDVAVDGSLTVNCPAGLFSCTYSGTLTVAAEACTTATGLVIDGTLHGTTSGKGIAFSETVTGTLTVTRPDGSSTTCDVNVTLTFGSRLTGSICGVSL